LDGQREVRRLIAAIEVVTAELNENATRIKNRSEPRDMTFGDWSTSKAALAGLALRDRDLWADVVKAYGDLYEWQKARGARPPAPADLERVADQLIGWRAALRREISSFSRLGRRSQR